MGEISLSGGLSHRPVEVPHRSPQGVIDFWKRLGCIQNVDGLTRIPYTSFTVGQLRFFAPKGFEQKKVEECAHSAKMIEEAITASVSSPQALTDIVYALFVPSLCSRNSFSDLTGKNILMSLAHLKHIGISMFAHEYAHSVLARYYGFSASRLVTEAAAIHFMRKVYKGSKFVMKYESYLKAKDLAYLKQKGLRVPFGPSILHEQQPKAANKRESLRLKEEATYGLASYFGQCFVETFGEPKFLAFYKHTCKKNVFDQKTGTQIVKNGQLAGSQEELIRYALKKVRIDLNQFNQIYDKYVSRLTGVA